MKKILDIVVIILVVALIISGAGMIISYVVKYERYQNQRIMILEYKVKTLNEIKIKQDEINVSNSNKLFQLLNKICKIQRAEKNCVFENR